jgi:ABC-type transport system involved in multi-copper enzyme maturation permease subunit
MIYIAIFFSVGVFISVISSTTGSAAMRCLFVWLLFVLIIPNATPHIARYFAPTPSMQDIQRQYDRIVADAAERRHADHVRWSKRLSNTKPVKKEEFNRILSRIEERITEIDHAHFTQRRDNLRKVTDAYENQLRRQIQLNRKLSLLSPYAVFTDVATTLANTNGESQAAFLKTAQQYEENYFHERYIEALEKKWNIRRHHRILYPPEFRVSYPELQERVRGSLTGLVLLFFYSAVFFMAGYLLFLRRPV